MKVLLIGLGEFGASVLDLLDSDSRSREAFLPLKWEVSRAFNPGAFRKTVLDVLEHSVAHQTRAAIQVFVIADLGEPGAPFHILDCGTQIRELEANNLLYLKDPARPGHVASFLTLSERLGQTDEFGADQVASVAWFLKSCEAMAAMPYDRSYIHLTPGGQTKVKTQTCQVFRERIHLEAKFYPEDYLRRILVTAQNTREGMKRVFSSFAFLQVPRLIELQKFHVRYTFEKTALDFSLAPPIQSGVKKTLRGQWLEALDLPRGHEGDFPADRMAALFARNLMARPSPGLADLSQTLRQTNVLLFQFIESEFKIIKATIQEGLDLLFQVPRLYGAFFVYREFLGLLQSYLANWKNTNLGGLQRPLVPVDEVISRIESRLGMVDAASILGWKPFGALKQEIKRLILGSPAIRECLESGALHLLAENLPEYLDPDRTANNPLPLVNEILADLDRFLAMLGKDIERSARNASGLESLLDSYYVRSSMDSKSFGKILERLSAKLFPESRKPELWDQYRLQVYSPWKEGFGKGRQFLHGEESFMDQIRAEGARLHDSPSTASFLEPLSQDESQFIGRISSQLPADLDTLIGGTFLPVPDSSAMKSFLVFVPSDGFQDGLEEAVANWERAGAQVKQIRREDSLGSIVAIKEWHFLGIEDLAFWAKLKPLVPEDPTDLMARIFASPPEQKGGFGEDPGLSPRQLKLLSNILRDRVPRESLNNLWQRSLGDLPPGGIDEPAFPRLVLKLGIKGVLGELSDDDLRNLARDLKTVGGMTRESSLENLEFEIAKI